MSVEREDNGRLKKGSILNPFGNSPQQEWNKLKKLIGEDVHKFYKAGWGLIKKADKDSVKATLILGFLQLIKPKAEEIEDMNGEILSVSKYREALQTIVEKQVEIDALHERLKKKKKK